MRLICCQTTQGRRYGAVLAGERDVLLAGDASSLAWLDLDGPALADLDARRREASAGSGGASSNVQPLDTLQLLAPVPRPGKIICIGLNYRDHAAESGMALPGSPIIFSKFTTAITSPGAPIVLPPSSTQVDYEAELAVVIGRRTRKVTVGEARRAVLGYVNFNDVSARDFQFGDGQWQRGKSCDTFAPMGPWIVTADEVPDPQALGIRLRVNGQTKQDSRTSQLIFGIDALIAFISETITLEPGDVIATGTPPGVGFARKPPVFLQDGDVVEVEVDGLGVLRNPVVAG